MHGVLIVPQKEDKPKVELANDKKFDLTQKFPLINTIYRKIN